MQRRKLLATLCAGTVAASAIAATSSAARDDGHRWHGRHAHAVALTADQTLIAFRTDRPEWSRTLGPIAGLTGDTRLVGIDYRPATGDLYGVGEQGGIYVIDDATGRATLRSRLSVPLSGTSFGVDFNPAVDRLRIVSDTGQNLRDNVDADGDTITDGALTYPGPPPMTATGVAGAAYTNNDADPSTATTLFDVDAALDQVVVQAPANAGSLSPTGKLGVNAGSTAGFDIRSTVRDGVTVANEAFAALAVDGRSRLYGIDLLTGAAHPVGAFDRDVAVAGIAIPAKQR